MPDWGGDEDSYNSEEENDESSEIAPGDNLFDVISLKLSLVNEKKLNESRKEKGGLKKPL